MIRAGGRERVRSAESTLRLMRWRVTESRATFLGTTTAYPRASVETTAEKLGEESRRPFLIAAGNINRGSRSRRENTVITSLPQVFCGRCGGGAVQSCVRRPFCFLRENRAFLRASSSSVDRSFLS